MPDAGKLGNLEDQIRAQCSKVLESTSEEELGGLCSELRQMLSDHIEIVRTRVRELTNRELEIKKKDAMASPSPESCD